MSVIITKTDLGNLLTDPDLELEEIRVITNEVLDIEIPKNLSKIEVVDFIWEQFEQKKHKAALLKKAPRKTISIDPKLNRTEFIKVLIREGGYRKSDIIKEVYKVFSPEEKTDAKARRRVNKVVLNLKEQNLIKENYDKVLEWVETSGRDNIS